MLITSPMPTVNHISHCGIRRLDLENRESLFTVFVILSLRGVNHFNSSCGYRLD